MKIIMTVAADQQAIAMGIGAEYKIQPIPEYAGPVTVTPRAYNEVVLATNGKLMTNDVTVHRVPYFETSNDSGETVYIAAEG